MLGNEWYLGLGMRYEAGICTIVISMNGAFQLCPLCCRLNFDPKSWKTMDYSLWSSAIFDKKCDQHWKLGHQLKVLLMLIAMAQYQASYVPWMSMIFWSKMLEKHFNSSYERPTKILIAVAIAVIHWSMLRNSPCWQSYTADNTEHWVAWEWGYLAYTVLHRWSGKIERILLC